MEMVLIGSGAKVTEMSFDGKALNYKNLPDFNQ